MAKAFYKDTLLAQSDDFVSLEGNIYFPPDSVNFNSLKESDTGYECPWKGHADYFHIAVGDKVIEDAAWHYPNPKPAATRQDYAP